MSTKQRRRQAWGVHRSPGTLSNDSSVNLLDMGMKPKPRPGVDEGRDGGCGAEVLTQSIWCCSTNYAPVRNLCGEVRAVHTGLC